MVIDEIGGKKMKKIGPIIIFLIMVCSPVIVSAQIKITEIMYDLSGTDTDREWVEIYNEGEADVKIFTGSSKGSWRFVDSSSHTLTPFVEGELQVAPGEYAILAKDGAAFMADWPNFVGTIFTSPLSLPNTGATLSIKDGEGNVLDTANYHSGQGANGDGNSLQKNASGNWVAATPTPGGPNGSVSSGGEVFGVSTQTSSQSVVTSYGSTGSVVSVTQGSLDVVTGGDRLTSVGSPTTFQATIKKNTVQNAGLKFSWSYGDGHVGEGQTVTHTYKYPGDYVVVLSTRAGGIASVNRFKVRVVETNIGLFRNSEYIEIENKTNNEINLFNWKIVSRNLAFVFQPDTIILPKSSIKIPLELLKLKGQTEDHTVLKDSIGNIVAEYVEPISEVERNRIAQALEKAYIETELIKQTLESRDEPRQSNVSLDQYIKKQIPNENTATAFEAMEQIENAVDPSEDLGTVLFESNPERSFISKIVSFLKSVID